MTEIKFKVLAPVLKGKDKGKLKWFEGVLIGDGAVIYISLTRTGVRFPPAPLIVSSLNGYSPHWDWRVPPLGGKHNLGGLKWKIKKS